MTERSVSGMLFTRLKTLTVSPLLKRWEVPWSFDEALGEGSTQRNQKVP